MADDWLDAMIAEIQTHESQLNNMKRAANTMFRSKGQEPPFPDADDATVGGPVRMRADLFYGKAFATAARAYLLMRKQAVPPDELVKALEQGGFAFEWPKDDRVRMAGLSMAKNTAHFHKLPNGMYGLPEWYPDAIEKKNKKADDDKKEKDAATAAAAAPPAKESAPKKNNGKKAVKDETANE